jgi:hypothetical protein
VLVENLTVPKLAERISRILYNTWVHESLNERPPFVLILSQINPKLFPLNITPHLRVGLLRDLIL